MYSIDEKPLEENMASRKTAGKSIILAAEKYGLSENIQKNGISTEVSYNFY